MPTKEPTNWIQRTITTGINSLIEPFTPVSDPVTRRRMQLLSALLLVFLFLTLLGLLITTLYDYSAPASFYYSLSGVAGGLLPVYFISRTKFFRLAILIVFLLMGGFPFFALFARSQFDPDRIQLVLSWFVASFLLGASLLSLRSAILLILTTLGGILLLPLLITGITQRDLIPLLGFLSTIAALILTNILYRDKVQADRQRDIFNEKAISDGIINGLPGVFFMYNPEGHLVRWNQRLEQITGYSSEFLKGLPLIQLISPHNLQVIESMIDHVRHAGKTEGEITFIARSGLEFPLYLTSIDVTIEKRDYLMSFGIDVTQLKQVDEARRAVVEHSLQGLAIYQDGRIVFANPAYAQMLGYSIGELYSMDPDQVLGLIEASDREKMLERMKNSSAQEAISPRYETRVINKDGSLRWMDVSTTVINFRERQAIQAASVDVTDRKTMEVEQSRLIGELEAKNAELERFTYTVSHDLKSPLITIRGFLGFLERDVLANKKARVQADLERITDATEKMQRLLNDLLGLSRIGRVANPPEHVSFEHIAEEAIERVGGQIRQRNVQVKINGPLPFLFVDRERIIEVVQNLVDNSVKFMGEQANPRLEIGATEGHASGMPILFIKDNGMGIEPEFHDRIFGLFNKLDPASEGTGVGLALAKRIIEVHGGKIWVESGGRHQGAAFYFTLPGGQVQPQE